MYPYNYDSVVEESEVEDYLEKNTEKHAPNNEADKKILDLLIEALKDEQMDFVYYGKLMNMAKSLSDKQIIREIQLDEKKHYALMSDVYFSLTGKRPKVEAGIKPIGRNLLKEYEKSIFSELNGSEFYRKIYFLMMNVRYRDIMFELLSDEAAHAAKLNFLYASNK